MSFIKMCYYEVKFNYSRSENLIISVVSTFKSMFGIQSLAATKIEEEWKGVQWYNKITI